MPKVYVVHEPTRWDAEMQQRVRTMDLSPAERHGEMVYLLSGDQGLPGDDNATMGVLRRKLAAFTDKDFLLPVGNPVMIGAAAALAANETDGLLNFLVWQRREREYSVRRVRVW